MSELPISPLFKLLGAVLVISVIAFLFLVISNFSLDYLSDSRAISSFGKFTRGVQMACTLGSYTHPYFKFSSSDFGYAITFLDKRYYPNGVNSEPKVNGCDGNYCLCLVRFKLEDSFDTNILLIDNINKLASWTQSVSNMDLKFLQCKSMKSLKCSSGDEEMVLRSKEGYYYKDSSNHNIFIDHPILVWFQSPKDKGGTLSFDSITFQKSFGNNQYVTISFSREPSSSFYTPS
jgi:hypothetical protein